MEDYKDSNKEVQKVLENIKKFRELKNITREQIAADLDMSTSGYSKIERGENELSLTRLYQIATALDVKISQILNFDVKSVFNITSSYDFVGSGTINHYESDEYKKKYIIKLEEEIVQLKSELSMKK